jgi:pyridoxine 5-phosphate synthase
MAIRLHINIDHVGTLRNARGNVYPDPVYAAYICEQAGADGITVHLRQDRRHMLDRDIERLRESVTTLLNLEMAGTEEMTAIAERVKPDCISLVPERPEERTTEGGLDIIAHRKELEPLVRRTHAAGIRVSFFIAADEKQITAAHELGAEQVELHTGDYSGSHAETRDKELVRLRHAADFGKKLGLAIAAGHGLTRFNVPAIAAIPAIEELNIGHAVISDSLFLGLDGAVRAMRTAIERGISLR